MHVGPQKMVQIHQLGTELPPHVQTNSRDEGFFLSKVGIKYVSIFLLHKHMVLLGEPVLRWHQFPFILMAGSPVLTDIDSPEGED